MEISYLGHSSFKIKGKSASVICDPFDPKTVGLKFASNEADIITISHAHEDHNKISSIKDVKKVISGPGEYEIMGISILGFPSYHDNKSGEERGKNIIFVFEVDGVRIAHLGDLGHELSEKIIEDMGYIDILILPVGGEYTIGPDGATKIVQAVEPSIVIPMHYQVPGLNPATFAKLKSVDGFLKDVGLTVERLPKLVLKKEDITEDMQKVVVLEKK
jgi:L-ascorbate metabolism protein UlaG (beta-lactamase superfamily)